MDYNFLNNIKRKTQSYQIEDFETLLNKFNPRDFEYFFATALKLNQEQKYEEALALLNIAEQRFEDSIAQFLLSVQKGALHLKLKNYENTTNYLEKSENLLRTIDPNIRKTLSSFEADLYRNIGVLKINQGRLEESKDYHINSLNIEKGIDNKIGVASIHNNLGVIAIQQGDYGSALDHFSESTKIFNQLGNIRSEATLFNNMGGLSQKIGRINKAMNYYSNSLILSRRINDLELEAKSLNNLGNIYFLKGDLNSANLLYQQSLKIRRILDNPMETYAILHNLGRLERYNCNFEDSISYLEEALRYQEERNNDLETANTLGELIYSCLENNQPNDAKNYFNQLTKINSMIKNPEIHHLYLFSKALIIKYSKYPLYQVSALRIFRTIIESEVINHEITILAIIHYLEIKLSQYDDWNLSYDINDIAQLVNKIYKLSEKYHIPILKTHSLILKAKLSLLDSNLEEMNNYISDAEQIIKIHDLRGINSLLSEEKTKLKNLQKEIDNLENNYDSKHKILENILIPNNLSKIFHCYNDE